MLKELFKLLLYYYIIVVVVVVVVFLVYPAKAAKKAHCLLTIIAISL